MKHRTALLIATMIAIAPTAWAQTENVEIDESSRPRQH